MPCAILMARNARRQRRHYSGVRRADDARGTSIRKFSRDLPEYRARTNAEVLLLLEWLRAKGMDVPAGVYMSHFEPGAAVQFVTDFLNVLGKVLGHAFLIFLTVVFILLETSSFPRKFRAVADDPDRALDRFADFRKKVKRHLVIKTAASLGTGIAIRLWLAARRVDYPMLRGLLAFPAELGPQHRFQHRRGSGGAVRGGPPLIPRVAGASTMLAERGHHERGFG